jgi:hypothetical protein
MISGMGKAARTKSGAQRLARKSKLMPEAFLEAVLDAAGDENLVLEQLGLRARELHLFLSKHPDLIDAARLSLEEQEIDTDEPEFGWLRHSASLDSEPDFDPQADSNWSQYRGLLQQEVKLESVDRLQTSLERTQELVAALQAKKRAIREQAGKRPRSEDSD